MTDSKSADLALAELHRSLGGRLDPHPRASVQVVGDYGSPAREAEALGSASAWVDRSWCGRLELVGEDRARFLAGLITSDVAALAPGTSGYGFLTNHQGRILADATVLALEDRLWMELPAGATDEVLAHLSKYIVMDRVEVTALDEVLPLSVIGPAARTALAEVSPLPDEPFTHLETELLDRSIRVECRPLAGQEAFTFWLPSAEAEDLARELSARAALEPAGFAALEAVRVEAGVPAFGADFTIENFPQETGLEELAVSYTKGCYLGQEVVARIHYRGQANHLARRLWFAGDRLPDSGSRLSLGDREVGVVGSVAMAPASGRATGIAVLHRRGAEPGTELILEGGGTAEVAAL